MTTANNVIPFLRAAAEPGRPTPTARSVARSKPARAWIRRDNNMVLPEWIFYRKYTEALLRRFMRCSLQSGRVPSMLGKEMFRGKVSSYRMEGFDDLLIFTHDVDKCMRRLEPLQQLLLTRIAVQEYTHEETAVMLHTHRRNVIRRYEEALDQLTGTFLEVGLLKVFKPCQEEEIRKRPANVSLEATYLVA